jgi:hypothetical protein
MGEVRITDDETGPPAPWHAECHDPEFLVIDDWYNDCSFWAGVETRARSISMAVIESLIAILREMPADWAIGISIVPKHGYILLFADRFMVDGPLFEADTDLADVVVSCQTLSE